MKPKSVLKFNGKPFDPNAPTRSERKYIDLLRQLPTNEVFDSAHLAERWNVNRATLKTALQSDKFTEYRILQGARLIWGHPEAIAEYRRQVEAARSGK